MPDLSHPGTGVGAAALAVSLAPDRKAQRPGWMERLWAGLARDGKPSVIAGVESPPAGDRVAAATATSGKGTDRGHREVAVGSGSARSLRICPAGDQCGLESGGTGPIISRAGGHLLRATQCYIDVAHGFGAQEF